MKLDKKQVAAIGIIFALAVIFCTWNEKTGEFPVLNRTAKGTKAVIVIDAGH